ncbi:MAG: class I SAM-dependent methyltransferase [Rickettsiales bacterium]|jgi:23S rRNA U2552 (ribose-2'-O)-methylase RlmE/FtsJ|nr:class I SAM-dependent methyltransferase [Rickettsiales bacterium]
MSSYLNPVIQNADRFIKNTVSELPVIPLVPDNDLKKYFLNNIDGSIHKWHHYFDIYEHHFARFRGKSPVVMEIGVDRGGSLKMWKEYFGPGTKIIGVDIEPASVQYANESENIFVEIADQSDAAAMRALMNKYPNIDVFIDDGGHTTRQQIITFLECYDRVAADGVYLVEDLHTNYWDDFCDSRETFIELAKRHIDSLNACWIDGVDYDPVRSEVLAVNKTKDIPLFKAMTQSISFYDSVIVFEKRRIAAPYDDRR